MISITEKKKYDDFLLTLENIPIFCNSWWLDIVCGKNWNYTSVNNEKNEIIAVLPFYIKNILTYKLIIQPQLTQKLGPLIIKDLHSDPTILNELLNKLPSYDYISYNLNEESAELVSDANKDFKKVHYTSCIIKNIKEKNIIKNLSSSKRNEFNKYNKNNSITFEINNLNGKQFYEFHEKNLFKKKENVKYSKQIYIDLINECIKQKQGFVFSATLNNSILGAIFIVHDNINSYLLFTTYNTRNILSYIIIKSILFLKDKVINYDFEGGMYNTMNYYYSSFGSSSRAYLNIKKNKSIFLKIIKKISDYANIQFVNF